MTATLVDDSRLHELLGKMVTELGAAANGALVMIGDRLGLFRDIALRGPSTAEEIARRTGTAARFVREWASAQAASGYVDYDADTDAFLMSPEQAAIFSDPDSPVLMTGGFYSIASLWRDVDRVEEAFRTGEGVAWGDHDGCLFCGVEKFFKPSYRAHLVEDWLPSVDGLVEKLEAGARVADIGCGHGASTIVMAKRFPRSEFVGYDFHAPSVEAARARAVEAGLDNVRFEVSAAKEVPGQGYDLVTLFDCLHDMGDPEGAARHARQILDPDGVLLVCEPMAGDSLAENLHPVGRVYYAYSAQVCTPCSLAQEVGTALGAQAGEKRLGELITRAGFSSVRRAAETPFNMILEARP